MSDWSTQLLPRGYHQLLSTGNPENCITTQVVFNTSGTTEFNTGFAAHGTANTAVFVPVTVATWTTCYYLWWVNSTAVSGNVDVGLYDAWYNQLAHTGSTVQAGTSTLQKSSVGPVSLAPGVYYLALVEDNTTGLLAGISVSGISLTSSGMLQMASAMPLPSTATPVPAATNRFVLFGAGIESSGA